MLATTFMLMLVPIFFATSTVSGAPAYFKLAIDKKTPRNPGPCTKKFHGQIKLVKDKADNDRLIICSEESNSTFWKSLDGSTTIGEYFDPALDCSDVVDRVPGVTDGLYWIKPDSLNEVILVWCDVTTDGGGYMLVGKMDDPVTWNVSSSNETVRPDGKPHWSSAFGTMNMVDVRIQLSTTPLFKHTKADWSFKLSNKRPFGNLLVRNYGGCTEHNPGIGDIAYVKDLLVGKVVNTHFRCSLFSAHLSDKIGWGMMNKCLQKSCRHGFAIFPGYGFNLKLDDHGSFSYSAYDNTTSSGILHSSTSFIGCSNDKCCACFGPKGGSQNYCLKNCTAINGGIVTKHVWTWIWIRSSVPKRAWRKCIEYIRTDPGGKEQKYRINEETGIAEKGGCAYSEEVKKSGSILVANNEKAMKKIPAAPGLLLYRSNDKKFFIQEGKKWNEIATEKEIKKIKTELQLVDQKFEQKLKIAQQRLDERISVLNETFLHLNGFCGSCRDLKLRRSGLANGIYTIGAYCQAYCDMKNGGWTLIARFSNADSKHWISSGNFWFDRITPYNNTTHPYDNWDMISKAFWTVKAHEFKITRSDDSSHTALLRTTSNCLQGGTFRARITRYGDFRNNAEWASNQCRGSCQVIYGGQYKSTAGFEEHSCGSNIQSSNYIGFWCDWSTGDGAVMMIGGGGSGCSRADHGIGITEEDAAKFGGADNYYDFGHNADYSPTSSYSLNLWVR